jgi:hypothetical protein
MLYKLIDNLTQSDQVKKSNNFSLKEAALCDLTNLSRVGTGSCTFKDHEFINV